MADKSVLLNTCLPAHVANKSSVLGKGYWSISAYFNHTLSVNHLSWGPTQLGQPSHFCSRCLCSTCSIFSLTSYGSRITFRKMGCCTFTNLKGGFQSLDVSIIFFHQGFILNEDTHTVRHCDTVDQTGFNFSSQFRLSNIDFSPWAKGAPQSYLNFSQKG